LFIRAIRNALVLTMAQGPHVLSGLGLLIMLFATAAASASPMGVGSEIDCGAVNRGKLNVDLAGPERTTRSVTLGAGEALDITFRSVASPYGSLTLVAGAGAPRRLLSGPAGSAVTFVAPASDTFVFEFAAEGDAEAAFTVTCATTRNTQSDGQGSSRHDTAETSAEAPIFWLPTDPEAFVKDLGASGLAGDGGRPAAAKMQGLKSGAPRSGHPRASTCGSERKVSATH